MVDLGNGELNSIVRDFTPSIVHLVDTAQSRHNMVNFLDHGLVLERCYSIALAMELHLSGTNPWIM